MKFTKLLWAVMAVLALSTSGAWAQGPVALLFELDQILTDQCLAGGPDPAGTPLPDGTVVKIYWDANGNGPDSTDQQPTLCANPTECPDGPAGTCNYNQFTLNGEEILGQAGQFYQELAFFTVGQLQSPPRYYYRICFGTKQYVSSVFVLVAGPQDVDVPTWNCYDIPCGGCPDPVPPQNLNATDSSCTNAVVTWSYPDSVHYTGDGRVDRFHVYFGPTFRTTVTRSAGQTNFQYIDNSILPNQFSQYQVVAVRQCATDTSANSSSETGGRPDSPPAPTNVRADSSCSGNVNVMWTYGQAFSGRWRVLRNGVVVDTSVIAQGPLGEKSVLLTNQTGRAQYCVVAVNAFLCTSASVCDSGGLNGGTPPQVTGVNATDGTICDTTRITWVDLAGENGYRVLRDGSIIANVGAGVTVFNDVTASCGTTFTYTVLAFASCGDGTPSTGNTGFRNCAPGVVTSLTATDGAYCDSTVLTWNNVANETRYRIYRRLTGIDPYVKIDSVLADIVTYRDLTGTSGTIYDYQVRPINTCGEAASGHPTNQGNRKPAAPLPTGVTATDANCGGVTVTWSTQSNTDSFRVTRNGTRIGATIGSVTSYLDTTGTVGTRYQYCVIAFGCGQTTAVCDSGGKLQGLPAPATLTASNNLCTHVFLAWANITGEDSFQVRRDGTRIGKTNPDVLNYSDSTATPGVVHVYTVVGYNLCGAGAAADTAAGLRLAGPGAISNLNASVNCTIIHLTWTAGANATSYTVIRDGNPIAVGVTGTSYDDTPPSQFVNYTYAVQANNTCGNISAGEVVAQSRTAPGAPTGFTATDNQCAEITLLWTSPANADTVIITRNGNPLVRVPVATTSYSDLTASAGVTYTYVLTARNECGTSAGSATDTGFRIAGPSIPTGLTATQTYCSGVLLNWSPSTGSVSYYKIRRGADSVGTTTDTFFVDSNAPLGLSSYTVEAVSNTCGGTGPSSPVNGTRLANPTDPTNVAATTARCDSVVLSWTASTGNVSGYFIYRDGAFVTAVSGVNTTYYGEVPADTIQHVYGVQAASDQCAYSDTVFVNGRLAAGPGQVTGVTATGNRCDGILLNWTPVGGSVDLYIVRRGGVIIAELGGPTVSTYTDTDAIVGTHSYTVQGGTTQCGSGAESDPVVGERLPNPPMVTDVSATDNSCESVTVTWTAATGNFDRYRLDRNGSFLVYVELPTTQYVDVTATPGLTYEYMVCAFDSICGLGPLSVPDNGTRLQGATTPTNLTATDNNCDQINVTWTAATGTFDNYLLYIDSDAPISLPNNQTSYTHNTAAGVIHSYFVTAISAGCGETDSSNVDTGLRLPLLGQVTSLTASADNCGGVLLNWDNIVGATLYYIYRDVPGVYDSSATNSYLDDNTAAGDNHSYRVSAINVCGPGAQSDEASGSRKGVPSAAIGFAATYNACQTATLTWGDIFGETGYIVHWGSNADTIGPDANVYVITWSSPTPLDAWVVAYNECGNGPESAHDTAFAIVAPGAVSNVAASENSCAGVTITWTDVSGADGYDILRDGSFISNVGPAIGTYTDTNGGGGETHLYAVVAMNGCGSGPAVSDSGTRLGIPTSNNLVVASADSCEGVYLSWDDVTGETSYLILRNGDSLFAVSAGVLSYADTSAERGVIYEYCIVPRNSCGNALAGCAEGLRATTPTQVLGLTCSDDRCDGVYMFWQNVAGELSYTISRNGVPIHTNAANDVDYLDETAEGGMNHSYTISAANACGTGQPSMSVLGYRSIAPPQPATANADSACTAIFFVWSDVQEETNYIIYRNGDSLTTVGENVTFYTDNDPLPGLNFYCVSAQNACGCSDTTCATATTVALPTPPTNVQASDDGCTTVHITWNDVNDEQGYAVWRNGSVLAANLPAGTTQYDDNPASPGIYRYAIRSLHTCISTVDTVGDNGRRRGAPPVPTGVTASNNSCTDITINWTASADADSYRVRRDGVDLAGNIVGTQYIDNTATPGTHAYQVLAANVCGASTFSTPPVNGVRLGVPAQVPAVTATDNRCDVVRVTWTQVAGATQYVVRRDNVDLAMQPGDSAGYSDATAVVGTTYNYTVMARNTCGDAPVSTADAGVRLLAPQVPTNVQASDDRCGDITVTWTYPNPAGDIDSVRVFADNARVGAVLYPATSFIYTPPAGTSAQFTVKSFSIDCNLESAASGANGGFRPTVPAQVTGLTVDAPVCDIITLHWTALNPQPDRYIILRDGTPIDSVTVTTYTDSAPDDARNHVYTVRGSNACGHGTPSTSANGSELALLRITGSLPDTVICGNDTTVTVSHCSNVTVDSVFYSANNGPYQFLLANPGNQNNLTFTIPTAPNNTTIRLRIQSYRAARIDTLVTETIVVSCLAADEPGSALIPGDFFLDQNFPNPFNPSTTVRFGVPRLTAVRVEVYDLEGRLMATLVDGTVDAGEHSVVWDCSDCPTGMYLLRLTAAEQVLTRKMLLMK